MTESWLNHWFRLGDTNFGDGFTLPVGTPIGCVSRSPHHLDLFAVGKDTAVYSTFYDDNGGWHGQWLRIGDKNFPDGFTLPLNTRISVVSRSPHRLDLFAVGKDGAVYSTFYDDNGGWHGQWFRIGDKNFPDGFTLPFNTPIAAISRSTSHIDLIAVGKDSAVYTTSFDNGGWHGQWSRIGDKNFPDGFTLPINTPIACVSRNSAELELFAVGKDGAVYTSVFGRNEPPNKLGPVNWSPRWGGWSRLGDPSFGDGFTLPLNTPIAAIARMPSHIDLFAVGKDTAVYSTSYDDNGGWHGQWLRIGDKNFPDGFTLPLNTPIACASQFASHLDLFAVGKDGGVYTTFYDDNGGLHGRWWRLGDTNFGDGFTLLSDTPIACVSRSPGHLDLFAVGKDTAVYSTFFGDVPTPTTWSVDSGELTTTDANPLSGNCQLTMNQNGDWAFYSHAHDAGFDDIDYQISGVYLTTETPPTAFTFNHRGHLNGTGYMLVHFGGGSRDDDFNGNGVPGKTGNNPDIAKRWATVPGGTWHCAIGGQDSLLAGVEDLLGEALQKLGEAAPGIIIGLL